jgi:hypothetical protein
MGGAMATVKKPQPQYLPISTTEFPNWARPVQPLPFPDMSNVNSEERLAN